MPERGRIEFYLRSYNGDIYLFFCGVGANLARCAGKKKRIWAGLDGAAFLHVLPCGDCGGVSDQLCFMCVWGEETGAWERG